MAGMPMGPYAPGKGGECPHCGMGVQFSEAHRAKAVSPQAGSTPIKAEQVGPKGATGRMQVEFSACPICKQLIIYAVLTEPPTEGGQLLWPRTRHTTVPDEVPDEIAATYREASDVLPISEKASAALSRRCLERTLIEGGGVAENQTLNEMIKEVLPELPGDLSEEIDYIRSSGIFAAHPIKLEHSGVVVEVEPGEAKWNLEILDALFDHYFVKPKKAAERRERMNAKRSEAGKPPLHSSDGEEADSP